MNFSSKKTELDPIPKEKLENQNEEITEETINVCATETIDEQRRKKLKEMLVFNCESTKIILHL